MSKRSWNESQEAIRNSTSPDDSSLQTSLDRHVQNQGPNPKRASFGTGVSPPFISGSNGRRNSTLHGRGRPSPTEIMTETEHSQLPTHLPTDGPRPVSDDKPRNETTGIVVGITRKVKACAACRKQKIKCLMDGDRPPCRRCEERKLSCVLNKSLQTHMDDESKWRNTVSHDLVHIHKALNDVLGVLSRPSLPPLETTITRDPNQNRNFDDISSPTDLGNDMCDISPRLSPTDESVAQVPIESLYEITRLRSLRSAATGAKTTSDQPAIPSTTVNDFITKGVIQQHEAERLVQFYITKLDPYIYGIGSSIDDLQSLRRASPVLTACICTVSALHEPDNNKLYDVCNKEFRRLVANTMFDRHLSADYLRALCIGSYWLSDVSWTLSGMAVRRAGDFHLHKYYYKAIASIDRTSSNSEPTVSEALIAIDRTRLWYLLYICDQHLSILYNRAPMIREEETIMGWKPYSECSIANDSDMRISSQVALLLIMSQVRELFGTDTSEPIPKAFTTHITNFSLQLDKWLAQWSTALRRNDHIGEFPSKGVMLHYNFGKLHLYSHVFRGLKTENQVDTIPAHFKDAASLTVTTATTILELILRDIDLRNSLVGVPHYFHTMIAFAGVVLLKVSGKYHDQLNIELESIFALTSSVISLFRSTACSRYHLVHWMASGLEKMLQSCKIMTVGKYNNSNPGVSGTAPGYDGTDQSGNWHMREQNDVYHGSADGYQSNAMLGGDFPDMNLLMSDFPPGDFDLGFDFL